MLDLTVTYNPPSGIVLPTSLRRPALALLLLLLLAPPSAPAQNPPTPPAQPLPEEPKPQTQPQTQPPAQNGAGATQPCKASPSISPAASDSAKMPASGAAQDGISPSPAAQATPPKCPPAKNWFARFLTGPEVKPLTPKEKAWLAVRNLADPFNAITIAGQSGISIASDSHSPYGPGMPGFARNVGVSYTEDMTGEFFGTFLIPSLTHQDPHYHRMPNASIPRRAMHAALQILWTQGDNGGGMLNYASIVGSAIDLGISNLYVPGEQTHLSADLTRYSIGIATAPIDNFITEFLPDVARRIHVRIVLVQRIINQVATTGSPATP